MFFQTTERADFLRLLVRASMATTPFAGGIVQVWSDVESLEQDKKIDRILDIILVELNEPKPSNTSLAKSLIAEKIDTLCKKSEEKAKDEFTKLLKSILSENIPQELKSFNFFHSRTIEAVMLNMVKKDRFDRELRNVKGRFDFESKVNEMLSNQNEFSSQLLGVAQDRDTIRYLLHTETPITIGFSPIMMGVSAIFFYLKYLKGYRLNLEYSFAHALELSENIAKGKIGGMHACVLGDAPSINIIRKSTGPKYHFVSLMPRLEQKIISPKVPGLTLAPTLKGEYVFIDDKMSTTLLQFDEWIKRKIVDPKKVRIETGQPHEAIEILKSGNPNKKLLLWTPHWPLFEKMGLGEQQDIHQNKYWVDTLLFFQHGFSRQKNRSKALLIAIRDAWHALLKQKNLENTIDIMMQDHHYVDYLRRFTGYDSLFFDSEV